MRAAWILGLLASVMGLAQERLRFREVERIDGAASHRMADIIDRLRPLPAGTVPDSSAEEMVSASAKGSEHFVRWKLPAPTGLAALTEQDLDIVVAYWGRAGERVGELWMWDDPLGCSFFLPLPESQAANRGNLKTLLDPLLVWWEPSRAPVEAAPEPARPPEPAPEPQPQPMPALPIAATNGADVPPPPPPPPPPVVRPKPPSAPIRVGGDSRFKSVEWQLAHHPDSAGLVGIASVSMAEPTFQVIGPGQHVYMELYRRGGREWLVISIGGRWIPNPEGMYRVAERFPPLRDRVPEWSTARLLAEFGRELMPDRFGSDERDSILLPELAKRDITVADAYDIVDRPNHDYFLRRRFLVVESLVKAGKAKEFESFIRDQMRKGGGEGRGVEQIFNVLLNVSALDVSDLAVQWVSDRDSAWCALHYLEKRAQTREVYDSLRSAEVARGFDPDRQRALAAIEARLHQSMGLSPSR